MEGIRPCTQDIASGKALAKYLGLKEEQPETIILANGARLVMSTKRDAYYFVSVEGCSCKGGQYGRICRHRKALEEKGGKWATGGNGPIMPEPLKPDSSARKRH